MRDGSQPRTVRPAFSQLGFIFLPIFGVNMRQPITLPLTDATLKPHYQNHNCR